jgi:hypothetical protein
MEEERIIIFQITSPVENLIMCLREDNKIEIGYSIKEVQNVVSGA